MGNFSTYIFIDVITCCARNYLCVVDGADMYKENIVNVTYTQMCSEYHGVYIDIYVCAHILLYI